MSSLIQGKADYWNKRLNRPASPPTAAEFVLELNRQLREEAAVGADVHFIVLRSRSGHEILSWKGPAEARALISRILQTVAKDIEMPAPFQMEPAAFPNE